MPVRRLGVVVLVAVVAIVGVVAYVMLRNGGEQAPSYETRTVRRGNVRVLISGTGTLEAKKTYPVLVQSSGVVDQLPVKVGDTVRFGRYLFSVAGQPLYVLKGTTPLYRQVTSGDTGKDVTLLQWSLDELGYDTTVDGEFGDDTLESLNGFQTDKGLAETNAVGPETFQAFPLPLRVVDISIEQGQIASKGTVAMTLANPRSLEVAVDINEIDIPKIKLRQKVSISVDALPGKKFWGTVSAISPGLVESASSQSQTGQTQTSSSSQTGVVNYPVTISLVTSNPSLKAGMQVNADIIIKDRKNVLTVPAAALRDRGGRKFVVVAQPGGVARPTPVEVGVASDTTVEIRSGLQEGQEVITGTSSGQQSSETTQGGGMPGFGRPPGSSSQGGGSQSGGGLFRGMGGGR